MSEKIKYPEYQPPEVMRELTAEEHAASVELFDSIFDGILYAHNNSVTSKVSQYGSNLLHLRGRVVEPSDAEFSVGLFEHIPPYGTSLTDYEFKRMCMFDGTRHITLQHMEDNRPTEMLWRYTLTHDDKIRRWDSRKLVQTMKQEENDPLLAPPELIIEEASASVDEIETANDAFLKFMKNEVENEKLAERMGLVNQVVPREAVLRLGNFLLNFTPR